MRETIAFGTLDGKYCSLCLMPWITWPCFQDAVIDNDWLFAHGVILARQRKQQDNQILIYWLWNNPVWPDLTRGWSSQRSEDRPRYFPREKRPLRCTTTGECPDLNSKCALFESCSKKRLLFSSFLYHHKTSIVCLAPFHISNRSVRRGSWRRKKTSQFPEAQYSPPRALDLPSDFNSIKLHSHGCIAQLAPPSSFILHKRKQPYQKS